jgi:predicted TIM-barrel enzyme
MTPANFAQFTSAHGFIVGSSVKEDGVWSNRLDSERARAVVQAFAGLGRDS